MTGDRRKRGSVEDATNQSTGVNEENIRAGGIRPWPQAGETEGRRFPKRTSLVQETASTLKGWMRTGALKRVLPGELQLKTRLGVGRDTLRLALKSLARERWISAARRGRRRAVLFRPQPGELPAPMDHLAITFLSPSGFEHHLALLEMERTQILLAAQGRILRFVSPPIFHVKHPGRQLERLVEGHPSAAWILYVASEAIQRWFAERGLPAILCELPFPGVTLPFVAPDWEGAAFHAGVHLVRHGHRVLGIFERRERRPGLLAEERGLRRALEAAEPPGRLLVFREEGAPRSVARSLANAVALKDPPTALVLTRASQLLTCYSWLASRGLGVPADISIVSLANDSWFGDLHPAVCYYRPDSRRIARSVAERALELATTGRLRKRSLRIRLEHVPGSTVGPVRADDQGTIRLPKEGRLRANCFVSRQVDSASGLAGKLE